MWDLLIGGALFGWRVWTLVNLTQRLVLHCQIIHMIWVKIKVGENDEIRLARRHHRPPLTVHKQVKIAAFQRFSPCSGNCIHQSSWNLELSTTFVPTPKNTRPFPFLQPVPFPPSTPYSPSTLLFFLSALHQHSRLPYSYSIISSLAHSSLPSLPKSPTTSFTSPVSYSSCHTLHVSSHHSPLLLRSPLIP